MSLHYKTIITSAFFCGIVAISTITAPFTSMFGKNYLPDKDFICCKKNQLKMYHYYTLNIFWIVVNNGYTEEKMDDINAKGCTIACKN